ncbi:SAM-dependent methyltransferase [Klebsiella michiganensis]|uniref:SAM-dependent methyltransferase n=1 Tax=Klebsiella michiganensis TaxID=1134687 RepID=A0A7H4N185_9ENTR|nr:SAM-dependent methyltransferase [Klebsiella michiganensis]
MGTTSIELAQRFRCSVYAIDMDKDALAKARQNIVREGVDHRVIVMGGECRSGCHLPMQRLIW